MNRSNQGTNPHFGPRVSGTFERPLAFQDTIPVGKPDDGPNQVKRIPAKLPELFEDDMIVKPLTNSLPEHLLEVFGPPLSKKAERDSSPLKPEQLGLLNNRLGDLMSVMPRISSMRLPPSVRPNIDRRWKALQIAAITALTSFATAGAGIGLIEAGRHIGTAQALERMREKLVHPPTIEDSSKDQRAMKEAITESAHDVFLERLVDKEATAASVASAIETAANELQANIAYAQVMSRQETATQIRVALVNEILNATDLTPEARERCLALLDTETTRFVRSAPYTSAEEQGTNAVIDLLARTSQEAGADEATTRLTLSSLFEGQTELPPTLVEKIRRMPQIHTPLVIGLMDQRSNATSRLLDLDYSLHYPATPLSEDEQTPLLEQQEALEIETTRLTHLIDGLVPHVSQHQRL